ncbi:alpha/beta fold hydrolase [Synechococcales cyanobacterium C]|uniref:Alpha/beta fold hydrolase n=1 Tax=Petrachloros mirabilis ULC683 TaxID=2781853 RepID=A0A8K1ZZ23_9CYAN|nr:alpha/beta hydrolase [Petrachloros mirabilis]NCJ06467.1 alpha/beta fold hydrolase [Petrachloros mirabilis ULC683]
MSSPALKTLDLSPYPAAYREVGKGPVLLFLHGFLGSSHNWLPLIAHLQPHYHCIALDLLGFGDSAKPELRYTIWHQVEFLHQVIQALNLKQFTLVGHSYGGWTAAAYAIAGSTPRPALVPPHLPPITPSPQKLVLLAPAGIRDDTFVGRYTHLKPLLWDTTWIDAALRLVTPLASLIGKRQVFTKIQQIRQTLVEQPVAKSFLRDRLRPEDATDTLDIALPQITCPTLIIAGAQDTTIPLWHAQAYAQGISGAQLQILPEAGHDLPKAYQEKISAFINFFVNFDEP